MTLGQKPPPHQHTHTHIFIESYLHIIYLLTPSMFLLSLLGPLGGILFSPPAGFVDSQSIYGFLSPQPTALLCLNSKAATAADCISIAAGELNILRLLPFVQLLTVLRHFNFPVCKKGLRRKGCQDDSSVTAF